MRKTYGLIYSVIGMLGVFRCGSPSMTITPIPHGVRLDGRALHVQVQFYGEACVRVVKWIPGGSPEKKSLTVIQTPVPDLAIQTQEEENAIFLSSEKLTVKLSKSDGRIAFQRRTGENLLIEKGKPKFTPVVYLDDSSFSIRQAFHLTAHEGLYGLGQHQGGVMNWRGHRVTLVQANTEAVTPFLVSTLGWGLLWDNPSKTIFEDTPQGASFWSDVADQIDYYLIAGENIDAVIRGYRDLTGHAPLYGRWAYGYWQSREHYDNRRELMAVAREYRRLGIPIDNLIQDWDYWNGAPNWGGMFFDPDLFPNPKEMIDSLHAMNYHLMISIWPAMGPNTAIYKEMDAKGYLYPPVGWGGFKYYDAFNPDANRVYWKYLKKGLLVHGIDAWWIDSTEPDVVNALTKEATEYEMKKLGRNHLGTWARYLNAYSLVMTDAFYRSLVEEDRKRRPFILTRSTFAGQQRNAATTWSGDIGANWEVYRNQIAAGLNHCMAGIPYWTFDIGGFVLGAYEGVFMQGGKDPAYQELYTRMFQFGAFCPIFRSHGSETPREIWEMGEFVPVLVRFDHLRYRLLPYIYSLAWKVTSEGYTLMRGLPMDFPHDPKTYTIGDAFLFGPAFLVCPVTEWMRHRPPEPSVLVGPEYFRTPDDRPGLRARYFKDTAFRMPSLERIDPNIDIVWYSGRPPFVTDSMYAIRWEGKLIPKETGLHQFHLKCFDDKRIFIDGHRLPYVYTSTEQYTEPIHLEAGRAYGFILETVNRSTGAARMRLFWKTPSIFAKEKVVEKKEEVRPVYLPSGSGWIDFWTGRSFSGGQMIRAEAPIERMPLFVRAGSIVPMGPFVQFATEKPADPIELRIYPGADGSFVLYEDENDNDNYTRGVYATIGLTWDDGRKTLVISDRQGAFPGMLERRRFDIVLVKEGHGVGVEPTPEPDRIVCYEGRRIEVGF